MLCLSRKSGEWIRCVAESGEVVRVKVHQVDGKRVRLVFDAPPSVTIRREELDQREAA